MFEVTHPERLIYPDAGISKREVVGYFGLVGDVMLPHLLGRPLTLVRYPKGLSDRGFFQKHSPKHFPELIVRVPITTGESTIEYASVDSVEGLQYLANHGTIEFHAPLRRDTTLEFPDYLVLDLDPPSDESELAQQAALHVKALLDELGLVSTPVASGGKGYHVYVALTHAARNVAGTIGHTLGEILAQRHPKVMTTEVLKKKRGKRVFVDWMRNYLRSTLVLPWSLRARPGAPVATPITWEELCETPPNRFTLRTIESRLDEPDPIEDLLRQPTNPIELARRCEELRSELGIVLRRIDRFGREH